MKFLTFIVCLFCTIGLHAFDIETSPKCVTTCWENSQYVSACSWETVCLCNDANFQSVVLQCLYSQCQTTQFGVALHQTLSFCSSLESISPGALPPLIRHQGPRKRQDSTNSGYAVHSAFVVQSATHSVPGRPTLTSAFSGTAGHTATAPATSLLAGSNATAMYTPVQISSTNRAARLRIGL